MSVGVVYPIGNVVRGHYVNYKYTEYGVVYSFSYEKETFLPEEIRTDESETHGSATQYDLHYGDFGEEFILAMFKLGWTCSSLGTLHSLIYYPQDQAETKPIVVNIETGQTLFE